MVELLARAEDELPALDDVAVDSRVVHLPLSWDDPATREAIDTYMRVVRDDAPWCPWNIEFIRRVNGLDDVDAVREIVFDAEYLVLGLGDVYLGAPVAVPVDPRHRLVTTKYNPARTWTPENAVGIGGAYLCIYGMEGPGGYQFVGRTVPVWSTYGRRAAHHRGRAVVAPLLRPHPVVPGRRRRAARPPRRRRRRSTRPPHRRRHLLARRAPRLPRRARVVDRRVPGPSRSGVRRGTSALGGVGRAHARERARGTRRSPAGDRELGALPDGAFVVEAPLHGCVARLLVSEGDRVDPGAPVVVLEAMKTESSVPSPVGGTVVRLVCEEGAVVAAGTPLVVVVADA